MEDYTIWTIIIVVRTLVLVELCKILVYNGNAMYIVIFGKEVNMKMARPYVFPDPDDRSKNNPAVIVSSEQVIGLYNQMNADGDEMQRVTPKVQEWFIKEATENQDWDEARFAGNQCILENKFEK